MKYFLQFQLGTFCMVCSALIFNEVFVDEETRLQDIFSSISIFLGHAIREVSSDPDDLGDTDVADLATKLCKEAQVLINLNMSAPVVSRMRSLLERLPDHTLPDVVAAIVRSTPDEKLKALSSFIAIFI